MVPWRREWLPMPVFLPGKFHGQRSLVGYSSWCLKESDTTEQLTISLFKDIGNEVDQDICTRTSITTLLWQWKREATSKASKIDGMVIWTKHTPMMNFHKAAKSNVFEENLISKCLWWRVTEKNTNCTYIPISVKMSYKINIFYTFSLFLNNCDSRRRNSIFKEKIQCTNINRNNWMGVQLIWKCT